MLVGCSTRSLRCTIKKCECVDCGQEGAQRSQTPGRDVEACSGAIPAEPKAPSHFCIVELPLMLGFSKTGVWLHCPIVWLIGGEVIRTDKTRDADFCVGCSSRRCVTHMHNFVVRWFYFVKALA
jgi:hypothetical protein